MASVPLAIVLVAALVVPLALIPGTFGFHSWPISKAEQVSDRPVREAEPRIQVVDVRLERPAASRRTLAVARQPRAGERGARVPASAVPAQPRRQTAAVVGSPGRGGQSGANGPGDQATAPPPDSAHTPASEGEPATPQPAPDAPAPQLANGEIPVLRGDEPTVPAAPASPVQPVAPVVVAAPPPPPAPEPSEDRSGEHGCHLGFGHPGRD